MIKNDKIKVNKRYNIVATTERADQNDYNYVDTYER